MNTVMRTLTEGRYNPKRHAFELSMGKGVKASVMRVDATAVPHIVKTLLRMLGDADGKPWSEDFAQSWGATAEADAKAFCALPYLYDAARRAYAFLAHSSLIGAAEVRAELEGALLKAGGAK